MDRNDGPNAQLRSQPRFPALFSVSVSNPVPAPFSASVLQSPFSVLPQFPDSGRVPSRVLRACFQPPLSVLFSDPPPRPRSRPPGPALSATSLALSSERPSLACSSRVRKAPFPSLFPAPFLYPSCLTCSSSPRRRRCSIRPPSAPLHRAIPASRGTLPRDRPLPALWKHRKQISSKGTDIIIPARTQMCFSRLLISNQASH